MPNTIGSVPVWLPPVWLPFARTNPEKKARSVVPTVWLRMLKLAGNLSNVSDLTVGQFYREVAKLGGFLARKSDGEPGWITIWRGWEKLNVFVKLANELKLDDKCGYFKPSPSDWAR